MKIFIIVTIHPKTYYYYYSSKAKNRFNTKEYNIFVSSATDRNNLQKIPNVEIVNQVKFTWSSFGQDLAFHEG